MNYKIKEVLVLLFIVIAALLIIGSVNAANTNENNTLMDDSLCLANVESVEDTDNDISEDIIAINNDDGNEIEESNSVIEVSKSSDKLGSQEDSDVPEETPSEEEVQEETSSVAKTATGNPLFVLLLCLIGLGFIPSRNKKH